MKTKEAPEKIYVPTAGDELHYHMACPNNEFQESIEYTRTDAFIKKACEFIRKGGNRGDAYIVTEFGEEVFNFVQFAEDFKNYMKGE